MRFLRHVFLLTVLVVLASAAPAFAQADRNATLSASATSFKWTGPPGFGFVTFSDIQTVPCDTPVAHDCDYTLLHVTSPGRLTVKTSTSSATTLDTSISIYASDASGKAGRLKTSADSSSPEVDEQAAFTIEESDSYWLVEIHYLDAVAGDYNGEATLVPGTVETGAGGVAPTVRITTPKKSVKSSSFKSIAGTAADDGSVSRMDIAVVTGKGSNCRAMTSSGSFSKGSCTSPRFLRASGTTRWSYKLKKKLKKGSYVVFARATDDTGATTTARLPVRVT
jgi:hypothetical protein